MMFCSKSLIKLWTDRVRHTISNFNKKKYAAGPLNKIVKFILVLTNNGAMKAKMSN